MAQEYFLYGELNKSITKVQSDYEQTNVFAVDYIKNKPAINGIEISGDHPADYYGLVKKGGIANITLQVLFFNEEPPVPPVEIIDSWNDPNVNLAVWGDPEASLIDWIIN